MAAPEEENNCITHKTTPSFPGPGDKVQTSTVGPDVPGNANEEDDEEEEEEEGLVGEEEGTSPLAETAGPSEPQESSRTEPSDAGEEPEREGEVPEPQGEEPEDDSAPSGGGGSSGRQSVDELMADWQEDLDAFQQMDKEEL